jgi:hypothetical protein
MSCSQFGVQRVPRVISGRDESINIESINRGYLNVNGIEPSYPVLYIELLHPSPHVRRGNRVSITFTRVDDGSNRHIHDQHISADYGTDIIRKNISLFQDLVVSDVIGNKVILEETPSLKAFQPQNSRGVIVTQPRIYSQSSVCRNAYQPRPGTYSTVWGYDISAYLRVF